MSVGLTGSAEQRLAQLEEAYLHVAAASAAAVRPRYKAAEVTRDAATGALRRTPSWASFGSSLHSDSTEEEQVRGAGSRAEALGF